MMLRVPVEEGKMQADIMAVGWNVIPVVVPVEGQVTAVDHPLRRVQEAKHAGGRWRYDLSQLDLNLPLTFPSKEPLPLRNISNM